MPQDSELLHAALAYARMGWAVLPLHSVRNGVCTCLKSEVCTDTGKHPLTTKGLNDASTDEKTIRAWWKRWPWANIGIRTGQASAIFAVDEDPRHDGHNSWHQLRGSNPHPAALEQITGSGGRHLLFKWPGRQVRTDNESFGPAYPGLDIRGDGGYIVAAPSVHVSGGRYAWDAASDPMDGEAAPDAPAWLIELVTSERPRPEASTGPRMHMVSAPIREGSRDRRIFEIGSSLRGMGLEYAAIAAQLLAINAEWCMPPLPDAQVLKCARSAAKLQPNSVPRELRADQATARPSKPWTEDATPSVTTAPPAAAPRLFKTLDTDGLPAIQTVDRELRQVTSEALAALVLANDVALDTSESDTIFGRDGLMVRIERDEKGIRVIKPLNPYGMRHVLSKCADWLAWQGKKAGDVHVSPPMDVVHNLLAFSSLPSGIPPLEGMSAAPVIGPGGSVRRSAGYDQASRWYVTDTGDWPRWDGDGPSAARWLLSEWLYDFPFADEASRANALALVLLPFLRPLIDEPTPLHLVDAPEQGTGKSLLVKTALFPALGRIAGASAMPEKEEEVNKLLFSLVLSGKQVIFLDNIDRLIKSPSLAMVLTGGEITGRVLGLSQTATVQVRSVLAGTSNNARLGGDFPRRVVWIRLNARMEDPSKRGGFKHPKLLAWTRVNRRLIAAAALAMCEHWFKVGQPTPDLRKGSFEVWCEVVGGVLLANGVQGFLGNDEELKLSASEEDEMWRAFYTRWWSIYNDKPVTVRLLLELATELNLLEPVLAKANSDRGRSTAFGRALQGQVGRVLGGLAPEKSTAENGYSRFKLTPISGQVNLNLFPAYAGENESPPQNTRVRETGGQVHLSTDQVQNEETGERKSTDGDDEVEI